MDTHMARKHEQKHLERDARLSALLEVAFDGTIIIENGIAVEVSQGLLDISGYAADEVVGRPITDFVPPEFHDILRQRQECGINGRLETVCIARGGEELQVEIVSRTYRWRGRTVRIAALRDITAKRRLEDQVRHAQKWAAIAHLASGVAHDFNNVLMVINSTAELLLQQVDEPHRSDVQDILYAAGSAKALARQLLDFARPAVVASGVSDINAVIRKSESLLKRVVGVRVELVLDLDPASTNVRVEESQLQQVIFNLAMNARDATPGGGKLVVRTRMVELTEAEIRDHPPGAPGRYVMLAVTDSGTGMSDAVRSRIFEPFFTTKGSNGGTGLGLAVVHGIVRHNRGFVVVDSTVKVGTTIAIYFPESNA